PLVQCLDILSTQGENAIFRKMLTDVKGFVEQGGTFSDALREHPKVFDDLFVNLIQAGEVGGILDAILRRLAVYIEKRVKLQRQVRSALVYPSAVLVIAFAVIAIMLQFVIPTFQDMFRQFGSEDGLPWLTQKIIGFSNWFRGNVIWLILGIIAISTSISYSYKTPGGKRFWHKTMITVPVLGPVMRKIAVARFTRTMGTLLSSGVPILDAMAIVARASGNVIVEEAINKTASQVREGRTMSEPLMETAVFPSMVVQMIAVGEQTGALDTMLNKIADFYEEEVDVAVAGLMSLIEPFMMVFIGGIVGTILIGMYLPIFTIADNIQQH
ncbi:MAG: type II secretion system F family protein, partial [Myxococcales bacterium]|nr:type II secretion system F family protein [Myxococcales bacterium]